MALVINLAKSTDRRRSIEAELSRAGVAYKVITALESRDVDLGDRNLVVPEGLMARRGHWPSVVACSLSHLATYRYVLEQGWAGALVLEDDVSVAPDLAELTQQVASATRGAEAVLYGYGHKLPGQPLLLSRAGATAVGSRSLVLPVDMGNLKSTLGYYITAEGCRRLADHLLPIRVPADEWDLFYEMGWLDNIRCVWPRAIYAKPFPSHITYSSSRLKARCRETMERLPGLRSLVRWRRRHLQDLWSEAQLVGTALPPQHRNDGQCPSG